MPSYLAKTEIPKDRTDVLHILRLNGDQIDNLSPGQIAAIRSIYFLDSDRSILDLIESGEVQP
jgi:hypothetical protein